MTTQSERIARDRAMVASPSDWPRWPLLPLMARQGDMMAPNSSGFLVDGFLDKPRVYVGLIWLFYDRIREAKQQAGPDGKVTWDDVMDGLPTIEYDSLDQLVQHWRVD